MVKFEVKVVGHPKPQVKWFKQGEEIVQSDEFQIENTEDGTSILIINEIYPDDTGEIKFEAFNSIGVAETFTQFFVEGKTKISSHRRFIFSFFNISKDFFQPAKKDLQQKFPLTLFHDTFLMFCHCCLYI